MIMNLCRARWNIYRYIMRPEIKQMLKQEQCNLYRFTPNMMYSITPDKYLYSKRGRELHYYFTYLSQINKYKPYFYNFTDEIYELGMNNKELSPFLKDLVTTLHSLDENSIHVTGTNHVNHKINLSASTENRLANGGYEWLSTVQKCTNRSFLKDLQFVGLLWCFNLDDLQKNVMRVVTEELEKRCFSFDTQSILKAATFLYIFKTNDHYYSNRLTTLLVLIVKNLYGNVHNLSVEEIILTVFVSGLTRKEELKKITHDLSIGCFKTMPYLSPNEVGVFAISNFLTKNVRMTKLNFKIFNYFMVNIDDMNEICFTSFCKYLKNMKAHLHEYELEHVYSFLKSFHKVMSSTSKVSISCMHGFSFLLTHLIFTTDLLQYLRTLLLESDLTSWRVKEYSYYSGIIGKLYPLFPESHEMLAGVLHELHQKLNDFNALPYQVSLALDGASRAGYYSTDLIKYLYGKESYQSFKDNLRENYVQHSFILSRLEVDEPELYKKIPQLFPGPDTVFVLPQRKILSFFKQFINISTKQFGSKVAKTVHNFNFDSQDVELRVKDGKLIPVDEWQGLDRCVKVVLVYTLTRQYQCVIGDNYDIYYELNGLVSCKLRLYEKSGYTIIVAKEERMISELPKYFKKLMNVIKDVCEESENNDVKTHYL